jgi:uncharacterized membrane protein YccF (DUF307 family)
VCDHYFHLQQRPQQQQLLQGLKLVLHTAAPASCRVAHQHSRSTQPHPNAGLRNDSTQQQLQSVTLHCFGNTIWHTLAIIWLLQKHTHMCLPAAAAAAVAALQVPPAPEL